MEKTIIAWKCPTTQRVSWIIESKVIVPLAIPVTPAAIEPANAIETVSLS
ncbi:hypothetical protein [Acidianus ambivalens]|nr:hypothetical protein [Acidianus ambivalens]